MSEKETTIVLETFTSSAMAALAKAKLDAHGIPCQLEHEDIAGIYPLPFAYVALVVLKEDAVTAKSILEPTDPNDRD